MVLGKTTTTTEALVIIIDENYRLITLFSTRYGNLTFRLENHV